MDYIYYIQKLIGMQIPVASGAPFSKQQMQDELARAKENKLIQERRQRENRNKNPRTGGRGGHSGEFALFNTPNSTSFTQIRSR